MVLFSVIFIEYVSSGYCNRFTRCNFYISVVGTGPMCLRIYYFLVIEIHLYRQFDIYNIMLKNSIIQGCVKRK